MKRIVRLGGGIRFASIKRLQRSGDLQIRGAAAGVVVRARLLVIQVAAEDDLAGGWIGAGNGRDERLVAHGVVVARANDGVERDVLAARQPLLQRPRLADRNHDRERVLASARVEMAPANQILIVAPPGAHLVRVVADQAGRAELLDRLTMARGRRRVAEHQFSANVLAGIVAALRAGTDVDELDGDVGALAVVGHGKTDVVVRDDPARLRPHFVEPSTVDPPAAVAMQRAEPGRAVAGKRFHVHVAEAGGFGAAHHVFDRLVKPGRGGNAVQLRQTADVILGRDAGQLLVERRQDGTIEQRLGGKARRRLRAEYRGKDDDETRSQAHFRSLNRERS